jgi:hypothetical protein
MSAACWELMPEKLTCGNPLLKKSPRKRGFEKAKNNKLNADLA